MEDQYLNKTGLSRAWTRIKGKLGEKQTIPYNYYASAGVGSVYYVTTTMKTDATHWMEFCIEGIAGRTETPGISVRVHAWYQSGEGFVQNSLRSWGSFGGLDSIKIHSDGDGTVFLSFACRETPIRFRVIGYYSNSSGAKNMVTGVVRTAPANFVTTADIVQTPTLEEQHDQILDFLAYHEMYYYPVILQQPQDVTVAAGQTAFFPIRVGGDGLTYEWWYRNPNTTGDEFRKSTNTTDTYSIRVSATSHGNGFFVYCVVTDVWGHTVQTRTASLTVG